MRTGGFSWWHECFFSQNATGQLQEEFPCKAWDGRRMMTFFYHNGSR